MISLFFTPKLLFSGKRYNTTVLTLFVKFSSSKRQNSRKFSSKIIWFWKNEGGHKLTILKRLSLAKVKEDLLARLETCRKARLGSPVTRQTTQSNLRLRFAPSIWKASVKRSSITQVSNILLLYVHRSFQGETVNVTNMQLRIKTNWFKTSNLPSTWAHPIAQCRTLDQTFLLLHLQNK